MEWNITAFADNLVYMGRGHAVHLRRDRRADRHYGSAQCPDQKAQVSAAVLPHKSPSAGTFRRTGFLLSPFISL